MIEHELILLGLLAEKPRHGYEIKKRIKQILFLVAGVDVKSVYYPLAVMEKKGLVEKHIDQQGRRPRRFIYELTEKGRERFEQLLSKSFLDFKRPQFSLDLSLYFLNSIKPAVARRRLRARMTILDKVAAGLEGMIARMETRSDSTLRRILEHNLQLIRAERQFLDSLVETFA